MSPGPARLVIAGTAGDSGKTLVTTGLLLAWRAQGMQPAPFKKGPDYIDAAWLSRAAGLPCRNLDTYLQTPEIILRAFARHATTTRAAVGVAVVEGNRGLLDGMDLEGTHSTATLARLLEAPVILVVNARKVTRTVAAVVAGCKLLEPDVNLAGVVLNRVAGARHEALARQAVEELAGVEVVGAIPVIKGDRPLPDRHLGLVTPAEHEGVEGAMGILRQVAEDHLDLDRILEIARAAPSLARVEGVGQGRQGQAQRRGQGVRFGYFSDSAFTFYYPENLEALEAEGAEVIPINSLEDPALPEDLDGLYLGGGFPETHAARLADNGSLMVSVREAVDAGMPVFAECGGMIYLSRSLEHEGTRYPMAGVLPMDLRMCRRPQGHGYMELLVDRENPIFEVGQVLRAHEFHYTRVVQGGENELELAFKVRRGKGTFNGRDGVVYKNVVAGYAHLHALGTPSWAPALVGRAACYRELKNGL